ncbi:hypothetical protein EG68_02226 [Paragonimus skrjabini miyazakii]|uniref:beta-N-acetylhexosaminidase n=1 Tax=Paragonimus skrjabini miyazakii TaxID=59628 RepID=A0A8S9YZ75_9TREM|nr:hypothetical protein EG68_02226 [Paragonimus skrjabini miyazakii]
MKTWSLFTLAFIFVQITMALVPKPNKRVNGADWYFVNDRIIYEHKYPHCYILHDAQKRLSERLRQRPIPLDSILPATPKKGLTQIRIQIEKGCNESKKLMWPSEKMNEQYSLSVSDGKIELQAEEIWGILHGLETIAQLVRLNQHSTSVIQEQFVEDKPRFIHRGYLIDTSRHFLDLEHIFQFVDIMSMVKMNVLHWHIVDDESFPYSSYTFPELAQKGSYDPEIAIYTQNDIKRVLEYCRLRGVRVLPEFDTPGHTVSWGKGEPELLAKCYSDGRPNGQLGPIDPTTEFTYKFMSKLFTEIKSVFPEKLIHLGGDEVDFSCWASNPDIQSFMKLMDYGTDYAKLQSYHMRKVIDLTQTTGRHPSTAVVWQEVFDDGFRDVNNTVIHVWKMERWQDEMKRITEAGFPVIYSSRWYLNYIEYGIDWPKYYNLDPTDFGGTPKQVALVRGGEATMWSEYVDETNLISRSWPRGAAVAERLWTSGDLSEDDFRPRLEQLRCQMLRALVPKPFTVEPGTEVYVVSSELAFEHDYKNCYILHDAIRRLADRLHLRHWPTNNQMLPTAMINTLRIRITRGCDESGEALWPSESMNEMYSVLVEDGELVIEAEEIWGVLHGLETIAQLVHRSQTNTPIIKAQRIEDKPLYPHRGFLIDTSRHYLDLKHIFQFVDAMAMVKMNILHWHIVDETSFPYSSYTFPELARKGAYDSEAYVYTQGDVKRVLDYCRLRGIRVMPEFDTPGHTKCWGKGYPDLLTKCYSEGKPDGQLGPVNPTTDYTYDFMQKLLDELKTVFPDNMIHLGGDEVNFACWASNPDVQAFMEKMKFGDDYSKLQSYYMEQLSELAQKAGGGRPMTTFVWQEVFDHGFRYVYGTLSTSTDLEVVSTPEQIALLRGGEAAMWGEYVDETNLISRSWPRGAAVAERLWSSGRLDYHEFGPRLEELRCRMLTYGLNAEPVNGAGRCPA